MASDWNEPLLRRDESGRGDGKQLRNTEGSSTAAVNLKFLKRVWNLMKIARCQDSILLILLSVVEVGITSQAGLVVGRFYNSLLSKDSKLFLETVGQYLLWYSAEAICGAMSKWAAEWLAIGWRQNLTQMAHGRYCSTSSLRRISQWGESLDNPDERITNEINSFCDNLAQLMLKTIAAPLMILYYSWWVAYHVGWFGPLVVYAFFAVGATWIRWIISPIAALVARQERLEAEFRISHVRFRGNAEAIALSNGGPFERRKLEEKLQDVLSNKKKLVSRHFLLAVNTEALDYLGGVLNYSVLAIPVFAGIFDSEDSGELANLISNASFSVLQLIYSFSQVMDTAKLFSDLAGHTSRVGEFFDDLGTLHLPKESFFDQHVETYSMDNNLRSYLINAPAECACPGGRKIQLSIHITPPSLHPWLERLSPPISPASLLIVPIFERTGVYEDGKASDGMSRDSRTRRFGALLFGIKEELDELRQWTEVFDESLFDANQGDEGDPKQLNVESSRRQIGMTCESSSSTSLRSEMCQMSLSCGDVVKVLLGYNCVKEGPNSVLYHPIFGSDFLLSFVLSAAPIKVLRSVLNRHIQEGVCAPLVGVTESTKSELLSLPSFDTPMERKTYELPAVVVEHATCFFPGFSRPVIRNLSFEIPWGESLLVMGPAGSGKTSFIRALCGLWPLHSGEIRRPPFATEGGILVLPQKTILATAGLGAQVSYPEVFSANEKWSLQIPRVWNALEGVGMTHLLNRCNDEWEMEVDWTKVLSPGEQQSVALARVLYHRPRLVILDEATSALNEDAEHDFYQRLVATGMSFISVSHRSRLVHHHTRLLVLAGDGSGSWTIS